MITNVFVIINQGLHLKLPYVGGLVHNKSEPVENLLAIKYELR